MPVVGALVGYGGCAGRWTARVAAGRDRRPRRTPGRRAAEGRVRRRGAPPLDPYKNNSAVSGVAVGDEADDPVRTPGPILYRAGDLIAEAVGAVVMFYNLAAA
ncbi:hypothetical protein Psi01_17990 [Planobispora siamensis]|uniref:Uncharacterized protein n=1 Tax=Planobispora siamensis TaxID=936338 RepID=A0A8J3SD47_9ACTN|nr:hypothetical protein Psi01_17990 [Planobispora siamensis]